MNKIAAETGQLIVPTHSPSVYSEKAGCLKIRLSYLTPEPKHVRSAMLKVQGCKPPFVEDVYVLMPQHRVFTLLETFIPVFVHLQNLGVVHKDASLQSFKILEEDKQILAYSL